MTRYLITGATGDVGSKVVERLVERGVRPAIYVRDAGKAADRFGDKVEIAVGDLGDLGALQAALEGVDEMFLVNSGPRIPELDGIAAKAAKDAGVRRIVKLSSLDVRQGLAIGAWHERGEEAIRRSGVAYTFLQPTGFMSNLLAWSWAVKNEGLVRSSTGEGRRAFIHSDDIAAVAVEALMDTAFDGRSIPLTGPEALTFREVAERIGVAIVRRLKWESLTDEEARCRYALATGAVVEDVDAHVALWKAIREGRLGTVTHQVEQILGRPAKTLDAWLMENREAFVAV